jgi:RNA polymerase sigma factor (sigma-70 family)
MIFNEDDVFNAIVRWKKYNKREDLDIILRDSNNLANYIGAKSNFNFYENVDDMKQNALERIIERIHMFDEHSGSRCYSYIYRIIYNSILGDLRKRNGKWAKTQVYLDDYLEYIENIEEKEENVYEFDKMYDRIKQVLNEVCRQSAHKQRMLKELYYLKLYIETKDQEAFENCKRLRKIIKDYNTFIRHNRDVNK